MPTDSMFPRIDIPDIDIWTLLFERKTKDFSDDKVIYTDALTTRTHTYASVRSSAISFGQGLKSLFSWRKGDVLCLFTPNSIDTPIVTWGTHWAGGVPTPANPAYTADELAFQLRDSGAKAVVTQKALLGTVREACKAVGIPEDRILLLGEERDESGAFKHFTSVREISGAARWRRTKLASEDVAFLVYSSGTTGHPKGVILSHRNLVSSILQTGATEGRYLTCRGGWGDGDVLLGVLPFYHIYGLNCLLHTALYLGLKLIVLPRFALPDFCAAIQTHRVTFVYVAPPILVHLSRNPIIASYDLSSLRMINSGAAPLTKELVEAVYNRLHIPVKQGYGLSETSPSTHIQPWEEWRSHIGSVGRLVPNLSAKYIAADGETEVPAGETGELWVKGPNVFVGYLNNEPATKNALTEDGYFKTGDVGFQDETGAFFITDRVKELIKYNGFQVPPAELEGLLLSHPLVADVAVIGVWDGERQTEVPRAYIVAAAGVERTEGAKREVMGWLEGKVAGHKWLRGGVRWLDEVPKSATGKILRRELKEVARREEKEAERGGRERL